MGEKGFSIKIFVPGGYDDGLRLIEKTTWNGHVILCSRAVYGSARQRPEFGKSGVYVLIGQDHRSPLPNVYVGEGDPIRARLDNHYARKEFWDTAVFFVGQGSILNKGHIKYLEARLIQVGMQVKRCKLENENTPKLPSLSEMDIADCEAFLEEALMCLPLLGVSAFEHPVTKSDKINLLYLKSKGMVSKGYEAGDGFVVLSGSQAVLNTVPSIVTFVKELRNELIMLGVLKAEQGKYVLTGDYKFPLPSTAAGVMLGRTANGREEWKDLDGKSLKEIQEMSSKIGIEATGSKSRGIGA